MGSLKVQFYLDNKQHPLDELVFTAAKYGLMEVCVSDALSAVIPGGGAAIRLAGKAARGLYLSKKATDRVLGVAKAYKTIKGKHDTLKRKWNKNAKKVNRLIEKAESTQQYHGQEVNPHGHRAPSWPTLGDVLDAFGSLNACKDFSKYAFRYTVYEAELTFEENCRWRCYYNRYPDLQRAFGAWKGSHSRKALETHWRHHGAREGRICTCRYR